MNILKPAQRTALERALAAMDNIAPQLAFIEQIAEHSPLYKERARLLRERQQYVKTLGTVALTADNKAGEA